MVSVPVLGPRYKLTTFKYRDLKHYWNYFCAIINLCGSLLRIFFMSWTSRGTSTCTSRDSITFIAYFSILELIGLTRQPVDPWCDGHLCNSSKTAGCAVSLLCHHFSPPELFLCEVGTGSDCLPQVKSSSWSPGLMIISGQPKTAEQWRWETRGVCCGGFGILLELAITSHLIGGPVTTPHTTVLLASTLCHDIAMRRRLYLEELVETFISD